MFDKNITGTERENDSGLIANPVISSTVAVTLWDAERDEPVPLYDEAGKYAGDIAIFMARFCPVDYPSPNLMDHFSLPGLSAVEASIKRKVQLAIPSVYADGEKLYGILRLTMSADLTNGELELFKQQIERQYANGWGGELEESVIETSYGDLLYVRLWQGDMEFYPAQMFKTGETEQN